MPNTLSLTLVRFIGVECHVSYVADVGSTPVVAKRFIVGELTSQKIFVLAVSSRDGVGCLRLLSDGIVYDRGLETGKIIEVMADTKTRIISGIEIHLLILSTVIADNLHDFDFTPFESIRRRSYI